MDYHRQYGVNVKIARIFNTYGPRLAAGDGRVVSNFISQALKGEPITVYGSGHQTRSFCYVEDLVLGIHKLMGSDPHLTGPINIGNPAEITVLQLAEKIISMTNSKSEIVFHSLPTDDPKQRRPDIQMAEIELGWRPQIVLDEGLSRTIASFKE
jgi:UDP-glucuronate decarboxylase